ncbi:agmatinase family protein [Litoribacter alkaliphilus]|uniref:Agmatinase family protein n=1 Tax=Litoribacter ruber TaxID=702568 RepID=A0AAP2G515_9BACT|nr:agmatinase family protein [Litoribacter alkaliphilus]MBS9525080.1 agmatinase family protein [Litoribacter alkaliphilus]
MSAKSQIIDSFDPNGVGEGGTLFGLPFDENTAELIVVPVPWEVTVSYNPGTADGPEAVLAASPQLDLYQDDINDAWKMGIHMIPIPDHIKVSSNNFRILSSNYIKFLEEGSPEQDQERFSAVPDLINTACEEMNAWVYDTVKKYKSQGKLVALLGGDHSTPLGMIKALSEEHDSFGILQIDAHADLRVAYENFEYSHASISYNALKYSQVSKLVQVGIRDYCEAEAELAQSNKKISTFYDKSIKEALYEGKNWRSICDDIIRELPDKVYITIDIDGLDPKLCPNTGTPVAGGFELEEVLYLMKQVVRAGKEIVGFDLVEVAPGPGEDEWDGNVGARVLYRMCNLYGVSQKRLSFK